MIQDFIYQNGLYLRDSQNKPLLTGTLSFQWVDEPEQLVDAADQPVEAGPGGPSAPASSTGRTASCFPAGEGGEPLGYVSYRYLSATQLFSALREHWPGRPDPPALRGDHPAHHLPAAADASDPCGTAFSC